MYTHSMDYENLFGADYKDYDAFKGAVESTRNFEEYGYDAYALGLTHGNPARSKIIMGEHHKYGSPQQQDWVNGAMQEAYARREAKQLSESDYDGYFKSATRGSYSSDDPGFTETEEHFDWGDAKDYLKKTGGKISPDSALVWSARHEFGDDAEKKWIEDMFDSANQGGKARLLKNGDYKAFYAGETNAMRDYNTPYTVAIPEDSVVRRTDALTFYKLPQDGVHDEYIGVFPNSKIKTAMGADGEKKNVVVLGQDDAVTVRKPGEDEKCLPSCVFAGIMQRSSAKETVKASFAAERKHASEDFAAM